MRVRGFVAGACLALACAGCSSDEPEDPAAPTPTPTSSASTSPSAEPAPHGRTIELRYTVKPRNDSLLAIRLPPQPPGGTMVTWSAYFSGIGTVGTAVDPLKVECYVVQATGPDFEDRVLYVADDSAISAGDDVSISGSGLVDTADGTQLTFECELDENREPTIPGLTWQTVPEQPIQVTLTGVGSYERRLVTIR